MERKTNIKVGVTVFFGLILTLYILGWAKNWSIYQDKKELIVTFDNVAGLEIGNFVTILGVKKGFVDDIYSSNNNVFVKMILDEDVELKSDAQFYIMMYDLMGEKKVEINPGQSNNLLDFTLHHNGKFTGDISTTMSMLTSIQDDLIGLLKSVLITLDGMNEFLTDDQLKSDLKESVASLKDLTRNSNQLILDNKKNLNSLLIKGDSLLTSSNKFIKENEESFAALIKELTATLKSSQKLVKEVDEIVVQTKNKENNLGRILYDENILNDLKSTIEKTNKLLKIFTEQLEGEGLNVDANIF
ncbi:MAG: ABC transporter substrate-binding protein [Ignavibacteriae bacterium]|nr:ABC transporter substrate-binding protein [Ignavibacteriota bacterium]